MSNKVTIIKVLPHGDELSLSREDLERWRKKFADDQEAALKDGLASGEIEAETLPEKKEGEHYLTIVKIGDDNYKPTFEDLEAWRKLFEDAVGDPDFKIFTNPDVKIEVINVGKIIDVE